MNRKKLQLLISMGAFSATLLSGAAYADDTKTDTSSVQISTGTTDTSGNAQAQDGKQKTTDKSAAQHGCSGAGGCAGK